MSRVALTEPVFIASRQQVSGRMLASLDAGVEVAVYERGTTTPATLYAAETGETTLAPPLLTDEGGRPEKDGLRAWLEPGSYDLQIKGETVPWEAVPGSEASSIGVIKSAPLNVEYPEYGAQAGYSADSSAAVQAALDVAAAAGGGEVFIPHSLRIDTTLVVDDKVALFGAGSHASVLKLGPNKKTSILKTARFESGGASGGAEYINIRDIGFDANAAENVGSTASLVAIDAKAPKIKDIFCKGGYKNLYVTMSRPELEGANIPEHGLLQGLELAESTDTGLYIVGPHDSHVSESTVRTLDGIGIYAHGTAQVLSHIHVYGKSTYGIHLGGGHVCNEVTSEGNTLAGVYFGGIANRWIGGWVFAAGGEDAKKAFVFGDGSTSAAATHIEGVHVEGCTNGVFNFVNGGEGSRINGYVFGESGEVVTGTPSRRIWWDVQVRGGQSWGKAPSNVQELSAANTITVTEFVAGQTNVFKVSGGTEIKKINPLPQGTVLVLRFADTTKVIDGENLHLEGNSEGAAGRTLSLVSDGIEWWEQARRAT